MQSQTKKQREAVVDRALASIGEIATLPEVVGRIIQILEDPNSAPQDLFDVVRRDPALSAKLLRVINSAFYGMPGQVADVDRAIVLLGMDSVKNLAIAASLGPVFQSSPSQDLFDAKDLWVHSVAVGVTARHIHRLLDRGLGADEMFLAGLLHDLGLVIERQTCVPELTEICRRCEAGEGRFIDLELEVLGATHEDIGEALVRMWRFPPQLRAAAGSHHAPEEADEELRPMTRILQCADLIACHDGFGFSLSAQESQLDEEMLEAIGLEMSQLQGMRDVVGGEIIEAQAILGSAD